MATKKKNKVDKRKFNGGAREGSGWKRPKKRDTLSVQVDFDATEAIIVHGMAHLQACKEKVAKYWTKLSKELPKKA